MRQQTSTNTPYVQVARVILEWTDSDNIIDYGHPPGQSIIMDNHITGSPRHYSQSDALCCCAVSRQSAKQHTYKDHGQPDVVPAAPVSVIGFRRTLSPRDTVIEVTEFKCPIPSAGDDNSCYNIATIWPSFSQIYKSVRQETKDVPLAEASLWEPPDKHKVHHEWPAMVSLDSDDKSVVPGNKVYITGDDIYKVTCDPAKKQPGCTAPSYPSQCKGRSGAFVDKLRGDGDRQPSCKSHDCVMLGQKDNPSDQASTFSPVNVSNKLYFSDSHDIKAKGHNNTKTFHSNGGSPERDDTDCYFRNTLLMSPDESSITSVEHNPMTDENDFNDVEAGTDFETSG